MFISRCCYTDDSAMTVAVAEALMDTLSGTDMERRKALLPVGQNLL